MTDYITLPRAVIEQVREAFKELDYASEPYVNRTARAALTALDAALEQKETFADFLVRRSWEGHCAERAASKLDAALAEPDAKPEPVAYFDPQTRKFYWARLTEIDVPTVTVVPPLPLYAAPPEPPAKREPATEKQIIDSWPTELPYLFTNHAFYAGFRAAERFHGIGRENK
jgi:hypothetical protein